MAASVEARGRDSVYIFTGLEHSLPMKSDDLPSADDELGPALSFERMKSLSLEHLGGTPDLHDIAVFNRLTGATLATTVVLTKPGDTIIGVSASHSHPSVVRAAAHVGAKFIDTAGLDEFKKAFEREPRVAMVAMTRLAVTYEVLPLEDIRTIVRMAHDRNVPVYVDDAGGARIGPAIFGQPRMLELGVDVGATGLDKYGTIGPRFGLMAGKKDLVARIRAKGFEMGLECRQMLYPAVVRTLEAYSPDRIRELVACTKAVGAELKKVFGDRLFETPVTAQLLADDILEIAMERGNVATAPIVPYEATAALCMLLLRDYGMLTVHFVGLPPGGGDLLIKFIPPETLERLGGPVAFAKAMDSSMTKLGNMLRDPKQLHTLFFGTAPAVSKTPAPQAERALATNP
jgi:L-seryl-tRNA(Ser) seleniumtransferase